MNYFEVQFFYLFRISSRICLSNIFSPRLVQTRVASFDLAVWFGTDQLSEYRVGLFVCDLHEFYGSL